MLHVAIIGKLPTEPMRPYLQALFDALAAHGAAPRVLGSVFQELLLMGVAMPAGSTPFERGDSLAGTHFVLSLGGDGTLLEAVTYVGALQIPILGINMGRLGFLATVPQERVPEALDALVRGHYTLDDRSLIRVEADRPLFDGIAFGLNEFSILKRDSSAMIVVHTYIDGEFLNSYWADGLIVSTPTGSTGYSLSCGGPVLLPHTTNFVIAPVCPHNLNVRPLIVPDRSVISFEIEGRANNFLISLDSRSQPVDASIQLAVSKERFGARLVKVHQANFLSTLRTKLNWGLDERNPPERVI
jgi:NAD+ kinase